MLGSQDIVNTNMYDSHIITIFFQCWCNLKQLFFDPTCVICKMRTTKYLFLNRFQMEMEVAVRILDCFSLLKTNSCLSKYILCETNLEGVCTYRFAKICILNEQIEFFCISQIGRLIAKTLCTSNSRPALRTSILMQYSKAQKQYSHILLFQNTILQYLPVHRCNIYLYNFVFIVDFFIYLSYIPFHTLVQSSLFVNLKILS